MQRLGRQPDDLAGILGAHEHGDHLGGVFRLAQKYALPDLDDPWHRRESDAGLDLRILDSHHSPTIGSLEVQPFPVPHDTREPVQLSLPLPGIASVF